MVSEKGNGGVVVSIERPNTGHASHLFVRVVVPQASATTAATKNEITLKGSVQIVTEFFGYSINR